MFNLYRCLYDWLKEYGDNNGWLYFNTTEMQAGNTSLNSSTGERTVKKYIDGSYDAELPFGVTIIKPYDTEQSDLNLIAMQDVELLMKWVEENTEKLNFGENYIINEIKLSTNTPDVSVDSEQALAKYMFMGSVSYTVNI